jgi:hypothetical protein
MAGAALGFQPRLSGWILIAGGVGYGLSAYVTYLLPDADALANGLTVPASIGEPWMIAYLLIIGVRTTTAGADISLAAPRIDTPIQITELIRPAGRDAARRSPRPFVPNQPPGDLSCGSGIPQASAPGSRP